MARDFLVSFGVGLGVGIFYALVRVNSPAPPLVALIGLLGMVLGQQLVPVAAHRLGFSAYAVTTGGAVQTAMPPAKSAP